MHPLKEVSGFQDESGHPVAVKSNQGHWEGRSDVRSGEREARGDLAQGGRARPCLRRRAGAGRRLADWVRGLRRGWGAEVESDVMGFY